MWSAYSRTSTTIPISLDGTEYVLLDTLIVLHLRTLTLWLTYSGTGAGGRGRRWRRSLLSLEPNPLVILAQDL